MSEESVTEAFERRESYLRQMGEVDDDLIAPLLNPTFQGGPEWPAFRQSWRVVRDGDKTIIISDGLSDPYDDLDEPNVGLGIEILGETRDSLSRPVQNSWLFPIVYAVSQQAADHGGFRELLDELEVLSMALQAPEELSEFADEDGNLGVLLGQNTSDRNFEWDLPGGLVKIVTVKLLHPSELEFVATGGGKARKALRELFAQSGEHHLSSPTREPVV